MWKRGSPVPHTMRAAVAGLRAGGADPDNILGEPGMPTRPSYPLSQDPWSASSASRMVSSGLPSECLRFRRAQDFGRGALAGVGTAHRVIPAIYEWIGSVMVNR